MQHFYSKETSCIFLSFIASFFTVDQRQFSTIDFRFVLNAFLLLIYLQKQTKFLLLATQSNRTSKLLLSVTKLSLHFLKFSHPKIIYYKVLL